MEVVEVMGFCCTTHHSITPLLHFAFALARFNFPQRQTIHHVLFVSQPLRATPTPNQSSWSRSVRCASGLIAHLTPFSLAAATSANPGPAASAPHRFRSCRLGGGIDNRRDVDGVRITLQEQSPRRVREHRDIRILHRANDPPRHIRLGKRESGMDGGDDIVELSQDVVGKIEGAVAEDVAFHPAKSRKFSYP